MIKLRKNKLIYIAIIGLGTFVLGVLSCYLFINPVSNSNRTKDDSILMQYGDNIEDVTYKSLEGENNSLMNNNEYGVIFYIDPYCESCLKSFVMAKRMDDVLGKYLDIFIIWRQNPNSDIIKKIGVSKEKQFIVDNMQISNPYPSYFIIDNTGKIIFNVDNLEKLSKKVVKLDCFTDDDIKKLANKYFLGQIPNDNQKPALVYFAMEGCKDCAAVEKFLESKHVQDFYNIITVYTEDSYGEEIVDIGKFFLEIYDINWYPSFVILKDGTYQFIGESSIKELDGLLFADKS